MKANRVVEIASISEYGCLYETAPSGPNDPQLWAKTKISRDQLLLRDPCQGASTDLNLGFPIQSGDALLPEEERILMTWDEECLTISTEESSWNQLLSSCSSAKLVEIIDRPGSQTMVWKMPPETIEVRL